MVLCSTFSVLIHLIEVSSEHFSLHHKNVHTKAFRVIVEFLAKVFAHQWYKQINWLYACEMFHVKWKINSLVNKWVFVHMIKSSFITLNTTTTTTATGFSTASTLIWPKYPSLCYNSSIYHFFLFHREQKMWT